jgi:crotonobetainyl-CoA:carnitine CoA-transferase CaiB-like acyl-CoA transferase
VRVLPEALADPAVIATGIIRDVHTRYGGDYRVVIEPLKFSGSPLVFSRPAPDQGEHTPEILQELGYGPREVEEMINAGAAYSAAAATKA